MKSGGLTWETTYQSVNRRCRCCDDASSLQEKLVIWDYHVLLILRQPDDRCLVYDLDSDLPFPTYFHKYVTETFRTDAILNPEYHRYASHAMPVTLHIVYASPT